MDRAERLLDLLALLLDATEPMTWAELRDSFPEDYGGSDGAAERKFERDKAELLELGIPIAYVQGDDERKDGYVIERDAYYLPDAGLTREELAVLYAAGSAALASEAFPGRQDLAHALRKVGFFAGEHLPLPRVRVELGQSAASSPHLSAWLEQLWTAIAARKSVQLTYFSPRGEGTTTERRVDPYGLALRQGVWSLVGFCHLRQGIRTFFVHRIRAVQMNAQKPRSADFEVPRGFRLDDYVASQVWEHRFHPPLAVTLELRGGLSKMAGGAFPGAQVSRSEGGARVEVKATYLEGLLRHALSLGRDCQVVAPARAVEEYRQMAQRILDAHVEAKA